MNIKNMLLSEKKSSLMECFKEREPQMLSRKYIPISRRYKSNANKVLECSVASPEATKKRLYRRDDIANIPPFKTWGKSRSLRLKDFDYTSAWTVYHVNIKVLERKISSAMLT